jgi:hypothetical protein
VWIPPCDRGVYLVLKVEGFYAFGLLSCKPDTSINFVAAILVGEISYLIARAAAVLEICYKYLLLLAMKSNHHTVTIRTMRDWDKFMYTSSCSYHLVPVC